MSKYNYIFAIIIAKPYITYGKNVLFDVKKYVNSLSIKMHKIGN